jgi:hypothetical protein
MVRQRARSKKSVFGMRSREQNAGVASASQDRTINVPALPRSNQNQATLFFEGETK